MFEKAFFETTRCVRTWLAARVPKLFFMESITVAYLALSDAMGTDGRAREKTNCYSLHQQLLFCDFARNENTLFLHLLWAFPKTYNIF
mmetsp:Transcript_17993/g.18218  ORF Transcript_17993/g.18218 Transcript_17993/m.18218 type:complete len:88 (+) Transcript_17993:1167-1430(+)